MHMAYLKKIKIYFGDPVIQNKKTGRWSGDPKAKKQVGDPGIQARKKKLGSPDHHFKKPWFWRSENKKWKKNNKLK